MSNKIVQKEEKKYNTENAVLIDWVPLSFLEGGEERGREKFSGKCNTNLQQYFEEQRKMKDISETLTVRNIFSE